MPSPLDQELLAGVSVLVPSYQGVAYLGACLDSLAAQTMDPDLFEVIVVLNGTPDGSRELVDERAALHPRINWRIVELLGRPGIGRARNAGVAVARHTFITLVDDDDTITPRYLEALYAHAEWDVVPMAWLDDVSTDGRVDESTRFNRTLARYAGQTVGGDEVQDLVSHNACKMLSTSLVRRVDHDVDLRSGVDVEFMTRLYAAGRFRMHNLHRDEGAIYLRTVRPGSASRQDYTFDFSVERRLDVIQRMSPPAMSPHPDVQTLARARISAQVSFIRNYLKTTPADRQRALDAIGDRHLPWFPWSALDLEGRPDDALPEDTRDVVEAGAEFDRLLAGVSVVVSSYQGVAYLGACLDSLAAQTMDPDLFEVIVVLNGTPDGSRELVDERAALHPRINWRIVELLGRPGIGRARNAGVAVARHTFITLIDDDDTITPRYLEALYAHAEWDVVPIAWLDDVATDGDVVDESTRFNRTLARYAGRSVTVQQEPDLLSLNACKLVPLPLVRRVNYDVDLRSGVDVEFMIRLYAAGRFRMHALRRDEGAIYLRTLRPGSASRQDYTFEFSVERRLDVIQRMSPYAISPHPDVQALARARISAQASFIRNYLKTTPADRQRVLDAIYARDLPWFPVRVINRGQARRLAISDCFPPYVGAAATLAAKRVRAADEVVDVIYNAMDSWRVDDSTRVIADPWLDRETVIDSPSRLGEWHGVETFCTKGWKAIEAAEAVKGPYTSVWSRAMWPAPHALAGLHALRRPGVPWTAELSEPLSRTLEGERRLSVIKDGDIATELRAGLVDAGLTLRDDLTLFELCELLAYAFASELHFTDHIQLEHMLSHCPDELRATVAAKARVMPQPILPPAFYDMADVSDHPLSTERINIGFFGAFSVNRGIGKEVFDAIDDLTPRERESILLHVFTSDPKALADSVVGRPAAEALSVAGYRPYLEFLALAARMDALLVNDAATAGSADPVDPGLPSTYSDYRGAGTLVWGHVEPGSPLSHEDLDVISRVGDVGSVGDALRSLLDAPRAERRTGSALSR